MDIMTRLQQLDILSVEALHFREKEKINVVILAYREYEAI